MRIKLTIRLEEKDHKALKVKTAQQGITIQEVMAKAVQEYLNAPRGK